MNGSEIMFKVIRWFFLALSLLIIGATVIGYKILDEGLSFKEAVYGKPKTPAPPKPEPIQLDPQPKDAVRPLNPLTGQIGVRLVQEPLEVQMAKLGYESRSYAGNVCWEKIR